MERVNPVSSGTNTVKQRGKNGGCRGMRERERERCRKKKEGNIEAKNSVISRVEGREDRRWFPSSSFKRIRASLSPSRVLWSFQSDRNVPHEGPQAFLSRLRAPCRVTKGRGSLQSERERNSSQSRREDSVHS